MLTRRREKRRFSLDVPEPRRYPLLPVRVVIKSRRKRSRFRVGLKDVSRWNTLPFQVIVERQSTRPRAPLTLAQRRQRRRTGLAAVGAVIALAIVGAIVLRAVVSRPPAQSAASSYAAGDLVASGYAQRLQAQTSLASVPLHTSTGGPAPAIQAQAAFLFDPERGWLLYQRNADEPRPVASLTKIMTLLVATSSGSLDQSVTIGPDAAALVNSNNSYMGVSAGERLTLRELLYGLMLVGGNDAARAIADTANGGAPAFVAKMNLRATQLGLRHTHFVSADGVSDGNISSARDLAALSAIAILQPDIAQIAGTRHIIIPQTATHKRFDLLNTNDLLPGASSAGYPGVNGVKTGYTDSAGYCMAFSSRRNGHLIVGVILGDPSDQAQVSDARALLDWGFAQK
ncbi:MAG TPA: D-alanyl-D-alanine carboxypeptidase family protein [Ktedonobacterales bacterium]|nr:D-alanyl-D-alanine carboxypeptidase family protein [Ktedonobacterales bacterium]